MSISSILTSLNIPFTKYKIASNNIFLRDFVFRQVIFRNFDMVDFRDFEIKIANFDQHFCEIA